MLRELCCPHPLKSHKIPEDEPAWCEGCRDDGDERLPTYRHKHSLRVEEERSADLERKLTETRCVVAGLLEEAELTKVQALEMQRRIGDLKEENAELRGLIEASDAGPLFERLDAQHLRIAELEHDNETVRFEFDQMRSYAASRERGLDAADARLEAANKRIADLERGRLTVLQVARIGERTAEIYNAKPRALTVDACVAAAIAEVCGPVEGA